MYKLYNAVAFTKLKTVRKSNVSDEDAQNTVKIRDIKKKMKS